MIEDSLDRLVRAIILTSRLDMADFLIKLSNAIVDVAEKSIDETSSMFDKIAQENDEAIAIRELFKNLLEELNDEDIS